MGSYRTVSRLVTMMALAVRHSGGAMVRVVSAPTEWGWPDADADYNGLGDKEPPRPPVRRARY